MKRCFNIFSVVFLSIMLNAAYAQTESSVKQDVKLHSDKAMVRPNVILVTISSLRSDHVGAYGYERNSTPNFDDFSKNSTLYTSAFATSSWQMPAHGSIITSLYPYEHNATHINNQFSDVCETLPEILSKNNYTCVGFTCNPRLKPESGFGKGFEIYDDFSVEMFLANVSMDLDYYANLNEYRTNDLVNQIAIKWLDKNKTEPFFLYLHYYDNHWDYLPPEPYYSMYDPNYKGTIDGRLVSKEPLYSDIPTKEDVHHMVALYDGEVRQTDTDLGELLKYLKINAFMGDTIVVVVSEHGEQFYEHGNTSHHGLYDELIHIPMAIHFPDSKPARYEGLVSQVDIMPTILDAIGLEEQIPSNSKGISLIKAENGEVSRDWVYAEYLGGAIPDCSVLRSKKYKVIKFEKRFEIYDLQSDKHELRPLRQTEYNNEINDLIHLLQDIEKSKKVPSTQTDDLKSRS